MWVVMRYTNINYAEICEYMYLMYFRQLQWRYFIDH